MRQKIGTLVMVMSSFAWGASAWAAAAAGYVRLIKGDVMILDKDAKVVADAAGKRSRKVAPGAEFYVGETVRTGADGRVKLEMIEGKNEVVLGSNTALLIERAPTVGSNEKGTSLSLARGEVRSTVNEKYSGKGADVYEVKTPNAVAGVRGTIFLAKFDPKTAKSEVATERGLVSVRSGASRKEVMVAKGMFTASVGVSAPSPAAPLSMNPDLEGSVKALGSGDKDNKDSGSDGGSGGDKKDSKSQSGDSKSGDAKSGDSGSGSDGGKNGDGKSGDGKSGDSKSGSGDGKSSDNGGSGGDKKSDSGGTAKSDGSGGGSGGGTKQDGQQSAAGGSAGGDKTASAGGGSSDKGSSVPLGREPVATSSDGARVPASASSVGAPLVPVGTTPMLNVSSPTASSPVAAIANTAITKTVSNVSTVNQTVNQTTQQVQRRTGTAIINLK